MATTSETETGNVLGQGVEVQGTLKFSGGLTFDGKLEGDIQGEGALTLGETAVVVGNLNVGTVVLRGKLTGNITARERIELKTKAELFGDVRAPRLVVEDGVTFVGQSEITPGKPGQGQPGPRPPAELPKPGTAVPQRATAV